MVLVGEQVGGRGGRTWPVTETTNDAGTPAPALPVLHLCQLLSHTLE